MDALIAWSTFATAVLTGVLAGIAILAWRAAAATLEASRRSSEAAEAANEQARHDSREQTRPYVHVEILPGLAAEQSYDVRITNTGRSSARDLTLAFDSWPAPLDDVAESVRLMFDTPRTLPPSAALRAIWRLEGNFTDGTSEAGMGKVGIITVKYTSDDPTHPRYEDSYGVQIDRSGMWPVPESGPNPDGLSGDSRRFYSLGQALVRRLGELGR